MQVGRVSLGAVLAAAMVTVLSVAPANAAVPEPDAKPLAAVSQLSAEESVDVRHTGATGKDMDGATVAAAIEKAPGHEKVLDLAADEATIAIPGTGAELKVDNSAVPSIGFAVNGTSTLSISAGNATDDLAGVEAQALNDHSARLLAVFDEPRSNHSAEFSLDVPEGFKADLQADGSVDIVPGDEMQAAIDDAGAFGTVVIAKIDAPWARDANGQEVETTFELHGDKLIQVVEPSANTTYPIVSDPRVVWMGYYAQLWYNKAETLQMRDSGVVVGSMLALAATLAAFGPAGAAIGAVMAAIGAASVGIIAATAANAVSDGRCLKVDVPSMYPTIVNC